MKPFWLTIGHKKQMICDRYECVIKVKQLIWNMRRNMLYYSKPKKNINPVKIWVALDLIPRVVMLVPVGLSFD